MANAVPAAPILEPVSRKLIDEIAAAGYPPIYTLSPQEAREALASFQSQPSRLPPTTIEDTTLPVGPTGRVHVRIFWPEDVSGHLPVVMWFHGGGWMLGDKNTHDRLARDVAHGTGAAVVFVEYDRAPEARYPIANEQAYAATSFVAERGSELGLDGTRLAVAGDSAGGNMAAVVALLAKQRGGPKLACQLLYYPVTDARMNSESYAAFRDGPWLTANAMKWFWDAYLPDVKAREQITASPLNATLDELRGLPPALVVTSENDVLRDEGEAYARKLWQAGVRVAAMRALGTIHDFMLLNQLAETPAVRGALAQGVAMLRESLHGAVQ